MAWGIYDAECTAGDITKTSGTGAIGTVTLDQEVKHTDATNYWSTCVWSMPVSTTGTLTLQVSNGSLIGLHAAAQEYVGMHSTDRVAGVGSGSTGNSTSVSTGSFAGTGHNLFVGHQSFWSTAVVNVTPGSPYLSLHEVQDGTSYMTGGLSESLTTSSTTQNATWTLASSNYWAAGLVVYRDTVADGGGTTCANFISLMGAGCK
jgi:hypothetical protein